MLSRKDILGHVDSRIGKVDVPEMGGEVCLASFTVAEADQFRKLDPETSAVIALVVMGVCDDKGERLFTDKDYDALGKLPASALGRIATAVLEHNGLGRNAGDEAKNASSETESDDSASASPLPSGEQSAS